MTAGLASSSRRPRAEGTSQNGVPLTDYAIDHRSKRPTRRSVAKIEPTPNTRGHDPPRPSRRYLEKLNLAFRLVVVQFHLGQPGLQLADLTLMLLHQTAQLTDAVVLLRETGRPTDVKNELIKHDLTEQKSKFRNIPDHIIAIL